MTRRWAAVRWARIEIINPSFVPQPRIKTKSRNENRNGERSGTVSERVVKTHLRRLCGAARSPRPGTGRWPAQRWSPLSKLREKGKEVLIVLKGSVGKGQGYKY